jgi:hypothetical protein
MNYPAYLEHFDLYRKKVISIKLEVKTELKYRDASKKLNVTVEDLKKTVRTTKDLPKVLKRSRTDKDSARAAKSKSKKRQPTARAKAGKRRRERRRKAKLDRKALATYADQCRAVLKTNNTASAVKSETIEPALWVTVPKSRRTERRELYQRFNATTARLTTEALRQGIPVRVQTNWDAYKKLNEAQQRRLDEAKNWQRFEAMYTEFVAQDSQVPGVSSGTEPGSRLHRTK